VSVTNGREKKALSFVVKSSPPTQNGKSHKFRIIYEVIEVEKKVRIWGIGKREHGRIYRMVNERVRELEV